MNEELMLKLLEEQQKTNELLQTIVSSMEQRYIVSEGYQPAKQFVKNLEKALAQKNN